MARVAVDRLVPSGAVRHPLPGLADEAPVLPVPQLARLAEIEICRAFGGHRRDRLLERLHRIVERPARNLHDTERVHPLGIALPARLAITQHAPRLVVVLELQVRAHPIQAYRLALPPPPTYPFPA